jgi:IS30 family transposase
LSFEEAVVGIDNVLTVQERARVRRLAREGYSIHQIAGMVARSWFAVSVVVRAPADDPPVESAPDYQPSAGRLRAADRDEILVGLVRGDTLGAIGVRIGRATSTVSREVDANGGRDAYRPAKAGERADREARRPKRRKLAACPALAAQVTEWLESLWSPEEIARRLRATYPGDPMMWVSHETIYQSLFVQGRGELRRELHRCLRSGRASRRPQHRLERRGRIPDMVMISERPAEVADRAVPGHWEGDLIVGKAGKSHVGTLVERSTRYVVLLQLDDARVVTVSDAMKREIAKLPAELVKTLTWDQGTEMSGHAQFTVDTGIQVYFCDPHSPWQRGSNENTNGLLRDFMPKGTDLSALSQDNLDHFAWMLNGRPRKTLGFMTPSEKLAEFLAITG